MKNLFLISLITVAQISVAQVSDPQNGIGAPASVKTEKTEYIVGTIKPASAEETKKLEADIRKAKARQKRQKKLQQHNNHEGSTNPNQPASEPSK